MMKQMPPTTNIADRVANPVQCAVAEISDVAIPSTFDEIAPANARFDQQPRDPAGGGLDLAAGLWSGAVSKGS